MQKEKKMNVHSTKAGKLYIKASELFAREDVQRTVNEIINSPLFKSIKEQSKTLPHNNNISRS